MRAIITREYHVLDFRKALLDGLRNHYNIPRTQVHASDLVNCRRLVAFERIAGKRNFSENTLMYFCSGEFQHQKLQSILGPDFDCEREIIWNGIIFHPDIIHKQDNVVIEIKTARTDSVIKEPKESHLRQLKYYMSVLNSPYGILQYIILNKYEQMFPSHIITFKDEREKNEILTRLEADAAELQYGIDSKDPSKVGHIATSWDYMIKINGKSTGRNWMCSGCDFRKECDEMRASAGEFKARNMVAIASKEEKTRLNYPEAWK